MNDAEFLAIQSTLIAVLHRMPRNEMQTILARATDQCAVIAGALGRGDDPTLATKAAEEIEEFGRLVTG